MAQSSASSINMDITKDKTELHVSLKKSTHYYTYFKRQNSLIFI